MPRRGPKRKLRMGWEDLTRIQQTNKEYGKVLDIHKQTRVVNGEEQETVIYRKVPHRTYAETGEVKAWRREWVWPDGV